MLQEVQKCGLYSHSPSSQACCMPIMPLPDSCMVNLICTGIRASCPMAPTPTPDSSNTTPYLRCVQARDEAQAGLADAQGRIFKLEVALAEGQKQAQQIVDLEKELARFRWAPARAYTPADFWRGMSYAC